MPKVPNSSLENQEFHRVSQKPTRSRYPLHRNKWRCAQSVDHKVSHTEKPRSVHRQHIRNTFAAKANTERRGKSLSTVDPNPEARPQNCTQTHCMK